MQNNVWHREDAQEVSVEGMRGWTDRWENQLGIPRSPEKTLGNYHFKSRPKTATLPFKM